MQPSASVGRNNLTPQQLNFAREHDAVPGFRSENRDGIFFYARTERTRWLVDPRGRVLDTASFRQHDTPSAAQPYAPESNRDR
jgi:hypothetical protein